MAERWVQVSEAAPFYGLTKQAMGQYAEKAPQEFVRPDGARRLVLLPQFGQWLRQHLQREKKPVSSLDDSKRRKMDAEAELAELEVEERRGNLLPLEGVESSWTQVLARLRATLLNLPNRFAQRTVGLDTLKQSQVVWDQAMRDALKVLQDDSNEEAA